MEEDINTNPEPSPNYFVGKHVDETDLVNKQVFKEVSTYKKYTGKHRVEN